EGKLNGWRSAMLGKFNRAIAGNARFDESAESRANLGRVLPMHKAERYFRAGLRRDHRFEAFTGITAGDAVEFCRRPRPDQLQNRPALLTRKLFQTNGAKEFFRCLTQC